MTADSSVLKGLNPEIEMIASHGIQFDPKHVFFSPDDSDNSRSVEVGFPSRFTVQEQDLALSGLRRWGAV